MTITAQQTDQWAADVDYWRKKHADLGLQYDQLQQRIKELERDAARYRHMRSNATFQDRNGPGLYWYLPRWNRDLELGVRLDYAIDRAISEAALTKAVEISQEYKLP